MAHSAPHTSAPHGGHGHAAHGRQAHYAVPQPMPWPIMGSTALFLMALGAVFVFNGHLGVKFNDVAKPGTGGLDPDEFWHAWARGREMTVDLFAPD